MDNRSPTSQELTLEDLTAAVARALNKTPDEIMYSETFEQAVYDMARSVSANLPERNYSGFASYTCDDQSITIKYRIQANIEDVAKFYNSYFPATKPSAISYMESELSFSARPFLESVLPALAIWKNKPSDLPPTLHEDLEATMKGPDVQVMRC